MRIIQGEAQRGPVAAAGVGAATIAVLALTVSTGFPPAKTIPLMSMIVALIAWYERLMTWRSLISIVLAVIFFIPIRRYSLPGTLPFQLEPYQLLLALILAGWTASLLVDPRVRLRRTPFGAPLAMILAVSVTSTLANWHRITEFGLASVFTKQLMYLLGYLLIVYLITSVINTRSDVEYLVRLLVVFGAVVAVFALFEAVSGINVFNHLSRILSFLREQPQPFSLSDTRSGRLRVYASAQHPIALSAVMVMLAPLALYLARTDRRSRAWWLALTLIILAAIATVSRTGIVMMVVAIGMFVWLRPGALKNLWPLLIPALIAVHLVLPGTISALGGAFFPTGGLIAQQEQGAGTKGSGRVADIAPTLREWARAPVLGEGFATRIVDGPTPNASILDDQWLTTLLEVGALGVIAWMWLFVSALRRLVFAAKRDPSKDGLLCTALAASILAFVFGMFTYDAFSFIQVTLVLFVLIALTSVLVGNARSVRA